MKNEIITINNLSKSFGNNVIFQNLSYSIKEGSIFGIVGLNGSGKTTFIKLLLGLLKPDNGNINILGFNPWKHKCDYYRQIGVILENDGFSGNLSVLENLKIFADAKKILWSYVKEYINSYWKNTFIEQEIIKNGKKVKLLSRGQKMQCAICRAFLLWPKVLFLDEPTVCLDLNAIEHFYNLIKVANKKGATIIISSHQLSAIEELCDSVGLIKNKNIDIIKNITSGDTLEPWIIKSNFEQRFGDIIKEYSESPPSYSDGAWHFEIINSKDKIPEIVSKLTNTGCKILEVTQEKEILKRRILLNSEKIEKL